MKQIHLQQPLKEEDIRSLSIGDVIYLTAEVCLMKGQAHARIVKDLEQGLLPPFNLNEGVIAHVSTSLSKKGDRWRLYSMGPSLSFRMEKFLPQILTCFHIRAVIGKAGAGLSEVTAREFAQQGCVHLAQIGGTPAYNRFMLDEEIRVYWEEMGPEKVIVAKFNNFGPLFVSVDTAGRQLFNPETYLTQELY